RTPAQKRNASATGAERANGPAAPTTRRNADEGRARDFISFPGFDSGSRERSDGFRIRVPHADRGPSADGLRETTPDRTPVPLVLRLVAHRAQGRRQLQVRRGDVHHHAPVTSPDLRLSVLIEAAPAKVFEAFSNPKSVGHWASGGVPTEEARVEPRAGGTISLGTRDGPARVLEWLPGRRIGLEWSSAKGRVLHFDFEE